MAPSNPNTAIPDPPPNMAIPNRRRYTTQYYNDKSAPAPTATTTAPPTDPTLLRIFHYAAPDLSYDVQIRPLPLRKAKTFLSWTTHTLADELSLFSFPNTTFSFNNFGPFSHFVEQQTPANIALISKVQWEAHDDFDIDSGSTLTVAKMLVELLPALEEVTIRLVMKRSVSRQTIAAMNLTEWIVGLEGLKNGLKVVVKNIDPREWENGVRGGSIRFVPNPGKVDGESKASRKVNWVE